jgi:D-sedoheptulose 7-phosphate isomerase
MQNIVNDYFGISGSLPLKTEATGGDGSAISLGEAFRQTIDDIQALNAAGNTLRFVGNGGSAGIASHMAVDFSKRGEIRANAFNDAAMLTCLGNDLGYSEVFAHQVALHTCEGDVLVAISSSGQSENILRAAEEARKRGAGIITFSGFKPDNHLRGSGGLNYYVDSNEYGFIELTHMALLSALIDIMIGWRSDRPLGR